MERNIRQFQVLKDPELFKVFQDHHEKFIGTAGDLKFEGIKPELQITLDNLLKDEKRLYQRIIRKNSAGSKQLTKDDLKDYAELTLKARLLVEKGGEQVGLEAELLSIAAERVRQRLIVTALFSVPLALILGIVFVSLLTRPIKQIARAIREIGKGKFEQSVQIRGPKDLEDLGLHLEWLRRRLNQLENEKQLFIKNISHELKTPLATLKEGAVLLEDEIVGELNREQKEIVQLMRIGTVQLNGLIENLLEYQNAISTQTNLNCSFFDLATLIKRIIEEYRLLIKSKDIIIVERFTSIVLQADRDKVRIIISNLISNALKFSFVGSQLGISTKLYKNNIYLFIEDQGKGITKKEKGLIFDEFYQDNSPGTWPVRGSGLGLKLVKDYVKVHRGAIKLLEPNDKYSGARFLLQLPMNQNIVQGRT